MILRLLQRWLAAGARRNAAEALADMRLDVDVEIPAQRPPVEVPVDVDSEGG